jgi:hypothetical protein
MKKDAADNTPLPKHVMHEVRLNVDEKGASALVTLPPSSPGKSFAGKIAHERAKGSVLIDLSNPHALAKVFFDVSHGVDPKVVEQLRWVLDQVTPKTGPTL